ncbi:ABC transporter substrate-binding protein [Parascardovia denticolens]|uniref:ABC transporter substrate-binding protein n=1 Tax=Parascardovia denticolens TaxID=78258 RepID=UPI00248DBCDE|nr:extracellular solute-binding protein [Parascardovia denticolens]
MKFSIMKKLCAGVAAVIISLSLSACGLKNTANGSADPHANDSASCTNKLKFPYAEKVVVWAWYPQMQKFADIFNSKHKDVQVCWTNAGQGSPEYTKFNNAIKAKKGAPDIIQLEYEAMPQFVAGAQKHLVDLGKYGMNNFKDDYTPGAWSDVTMGGGEQVYGVPVDQGPFVMYINQTVFDKYNVRVPTTWSEFEEAGKDLKAAGYKGYLTDWNPSGTAVNISLFAQTGTKVYSYKASSADKVGINFDQPGVKKVLSYWQKLVKEGLSDTTDANTTDWNNQMLTGNYAAYVQASWLVGYLKGLKNDTSQKFRVYPAPKWDDSTPYVNQGGSAWAVTDQAKDTKVAAKVAREIFDSDEAQKVAVEEAGLFPTWARMLESGTFKGMKESFFGDQKINEIEGPAAQAYQGYEFLPFQTYAYDQQTKAFTKIVKDGGSPDSGVKDLNDTLKQYAKQQGFALR